MPNLSFLHISDLHYESKRQTDRGFVASALLKDLRERRAEGQEFDLVILSGDIVNAGEDKASFDQVHKDFLLPLCDAAAVSMQRLVLCPGNHDVNRKAITAFVDGGLKEQLSSVAAINAFIDDTLGADAHTFASRAALERMDAYESFYAGLDFGDHLSNNVFFKTRIVPINGYKLGIAALNSAWRANGSGNDRDHLIIGERAVDLAIADLDNADIRVCVAHHPLDWLMECDRTAIENRLSDSFDIVCFGHTHRSAPKYELSPMSATLISQSGSVYADRKWFNGYQTIEWDSIARTVHVRCRSYFDRRRVFAPAENVSPRGEFSFTLQPGANRVELTEVELFLRQGRASIRDAADEQISFARAKGDVRKEIFSEAFVIPPLLEHLDASLLIKPEGDTDRRDRERTPDDLLRTSNSIVLLGPSESGRTSLLHHMAVRVAEGVCDKARIPAIVSMTLVEKSGYEKALRAYYAGADVKISTITKAIRDLPWIVFLDDTSVRDDKHLSLIEKIRKDHPEHRLVMVANSQFFKDFRAKVDKLVQGVDIEFLPRRSIRQLSKVRFAGVVNTGLEDPAYQIIMKHINESRLPRTGYMVALLLWAAEQDKLGNALNEAVLLENLVSFLLGKTNFAAALRDHFDPRAQEILLRSIATKLRSLDGWMESNELLKFVIGYFESRGLGHGAREVLDEFIACRLLIEQNGFVGFRYSCFQEYFVALDFRHDAAALEKVLAAPSETVLSYKRELDLWSSLSREMQGADVSLRRVLKENGLTREELRSDLADIAFVGNELRLTRSRVSVLLDNPPTKDQIDEVLDKIDRARGGRRRRAPSAERVESGKLEPGEVADDPDFWEAAKRIGRQRQALQILAKIVRNADHELVDRKKKMVDEVFHLWSANAHDLLDLLSEALLEIGRDQVGQPKSAVKLTTDDLDKINNVLKYVFAYSDAIELGASIASESLREPMRALAEDITVKEGVRFFAAFAYAETWDREGISLVRRVLGTIKNNVLRYAAMQKMLNDYRFQRYRLADADAFRDLIVEAEMLIMGVSKRSKGALLESLREQEQG